MPNPSDIDFVAIDSSIRQILGDTRSNAAEHVAAIIRILDSNDALRGLFGQKIAEALRTIHELEALGVRTVVDAPATKFQPSPGTEFGDTLRGLWERFDRAAPPEDVSLYGVHYTRSDMAHAGEEALRELSILEEYVRANFPEVVSQRVRTTVEHTIHAIERLRRSEHTDAKKGTYGYFYGKNPTTPEEAVALLQMITNVGPLDDPESVINQCRTVIMTYGRSRYVAANSPESREKQYYDNARDIVIESLRREFVGSDTLYDILHTFLQRFVAELRSRDTVQTRRSLMLEAIHLLDALSEDEQQDEVVRHDAGDLVGRLRAEWSMI